ncbi:hypothetical protein RFI_40245 [Reticulomyxa filosa]|uniref:Uncharacterized protein n=1 Tax=Reticulomyxa filosa TaxID=46433 RepID=X6L8C1_RETFI|nr:hypothetical protein RFI_40245 [Reticulomyxa filosa]|eukprot:ETN97286.1 hypothetical protein RFI_40245 [Reticulomyxa filosa]
MLKKGKRKKGDNKKKKEKCEKKKKGEKKKKINNNEKRKLCFKFYCFILILIMPRAGYQHKVSNFFSLCIFILKISNVKIYL